MRANLGLKRGAFELDMDTGIMRYHTYGRAFGCGTAV